MKIRKKMIVGSGLVGIFLMFLIFCYIALRYHIYNRTDCVAFNIDNIEVRTGINIPSVVDTKCDSDGKIKKAIFTIDASKVNMDLYINRNKFYKKDSVYINKGKTQNTIWNATLNRQSAILNVKIEYIDKIE